MDKSSDRNQGDLEVNSVKCKDRNLKFRALRRRYSRKRKGFQGGKVAEKRKKVDNHSSSSTSARMATPTTSEREEVMDLPQTSAEFKEMRNVSKEKLERNLDRELDISSVSTRSSSSKIDMKRAEGFKLQDPNLLTLCLNTAAMCRNCKKRTSRLELYERPSIGGLSEKLFLKCTVCSKTTELNTSPCVEIESYRTAEANLRSVFASQSIGHSGLSAFFSDMNMSPPVSQAPYNNINKHLWWIAKQQANDVLNAAANSLIEFTLDEHPEDVHIDDNGAMICDVAVTVDGTWQKRGHSSKIGVVFVLSVQTGEVLDFEVKSLYCHECTAHWHEDKTTDRFKRWLQDHQTECSINHSGSSEAMEAEAAKDIFLRSVEKLGLRYTVFVGDGDSSCFSSVKQKCFEVFGENYIIVKEECVGHIQKRLGSGLREYKRKNKGSKLSDGKEIGGKGRLTDKVIDRMQNYYGSAIRNSTGNKDAMKKAIWAIYNHMIRNEKESLEKQHGFCPRGQQSWCKFWRNDGTYDETKRLPSAFLKELKPIFTRLSEDALLQRCLLGLTQNQNESINGLLWSLCPKTKFCGRRRVEIGVCNAVCYFNQGAITRCSFLSTSGIAPGINMTVAALKKDDKRIRNAETKISKKYREKRRKLRAKRKSQQKENTMYYPGGFGLSSKPELEFLTSTPKKSGAHRPKSTSEKRQREASKERSTGRKEKTKATEHYIKIKFVDEQNIVIFS